jgi:hypothetical protein
LGVPSDVRQAITEVYNPEPSEPWTRESLQSFVEQSLAAHGGAEDPTAAHPAGDRTDFSGIQGMVGRVEAERAEDSARWERGQGQAAEAAARMNEQRREFYENASMSFDGGPGVDADALAQSLAVGFVTDASGQPRIDPETGQPIPVDASTIWEGIRGQRFNMGALTMPGSPIRERPWFDPNRTSKNPYSPFSGGGGSSGAMYGSGLPSGLYGSGKVSPSSYGPNRPSIRDKRRYLTPSQAMGLLGSMDEDYIIKLQQQMFDAGLFGEDLPSWGRADEATRRAFMGLFAEASQRDGIPVSRVLQDLMEENLRRQGVDGEGGLGGTPGMSVELPDFEPSVTSAATLTEMVNDLAQDLIGEFLPEDQRNALVQRMQARETELQRQQWERDVNNVRQNAGAQYDQDVANQGGGGGDIDRFMAAISGQESGGNPNAVNADSGAHGEFQIMPGNWRSWAQAAGLPGNAPRSAENQRIVARHRMLYYFNKFGNWRDVAIAWYAGEGAAGGGYGPGALNRPQGGGRYPSINRYADQILERMGAPTGAGGQGGGLTFFGGEEHSPIEAFDAQAEIQAAIKAQDPAGWEAHEFADRAVQFFGLLSGAV